MAPIASRSRFPLPALEIVGLTICLAACSGGNSEGQISLAAAPAPSASAVQPVPKDSSEFGHGHFMGEITVAGRSYASEALLTVDGEVRIYVGGAADAWLRSGAGPSEEWFHPQESVLFVGTIGSVDGTSASGIGSVIGQICDSDSARFCDEPAPAEVFFEVSYGFQRKDLAGELVVASENGEERWPLDLSSHSIYYASSTGLPGEYPGVFEERLAPFAQAEAMPLEIGPDGQLSFTSEVSGCTGDGMLLPHLDGRYDVYDVHLRITDCNAQFAYLDSEFDGLATETQSGIWDYDTWLVLFLSAPEGPPPRPAVTMRAYLVDPADGDPVYWGWDY